MAEAGASFIKRSISINPMGNVICRYIEDSGNVQEATNEEDDSSTGFEIESLADAADNGKEFSQPSNVDSDHIQNQFAEYGEEGQASVFTNEPINSKSEEVPQRSLQLRAQPREVERFQVTWSKVDKKAKKLAERAAAKQAKAVEFNLEAFLERPTSTAIHELTAEQLDHVYGAKELGPRPTLLTEAREKLRKVLLRKSGASRESPVDLNGDSSEPTEQTPMTATEEEEPPAWAKSMMPILTNQLDYVQSEVKRLKVRQAESAAEAAAIHAKAEAEKKASEEKHRRQVNDLQKRIRDLEADASRNQLIWTKERAEAVNMQVKRKQECADHAGALKASAYLVKASQKLAEVKTARLELVERSLDKILDAAIRQAQCDPASSSSSALEDRRHRLEQQRSDHAKEVREIELRMEKATVLRDQFDRTSAAGGDKVNPKRSKSGTSQHTSTNISVGRNKRTTASTAQATPVLFERGLSSVKNNEPSDKTAPSRLLGSTSPVCAQDSCPFRLPLQSLGNSQNLNQQGVCPARSPGQNEGTMAEEAGMYVDEWTSSSDNNNDDSDYEEDNLHSRESKSTSLAVARPLEAGSKKRKKTFIFPAKSTFHGNFTAQQENSPLELSEETTTLHRLKKQKVTEQCSNAPKHILLRSYAF